MSAMSSTVTDSGRFTVFEIAPEMNGCAAAIIFTWLIGRVAERRERQRHRLVDDRHLTAADQLLELDEREVRLDAGRVAVHQEGDRPGGGEHRRLRVAVAVLLAERDGLVP